MESLLNQIPKMLTGDELRDAMTSLPAYNEKIQEADAASRLIALSDIYQIYLPSNMSVEIYSKIYLSLLRSLKKKATKESIEQLEANHKAMKGEQFVGLIGGADSFSIIAPSGSGKSSAIMKSIALINGNKLIECDKSSSKIIPFIMCQCPHDCSNKSLLIEILRQTDIILGSKYYERAIRTKATTDILIGSVSQVVIHHIGLLVIDEIQNVVEHKGGNKLMAMLTQLINCSGVGICMVGTPESKIFFESKYRIARRSIGLMYEPLPYNQYFIDLCKMLYRYQYVKYRTEITDGIIEWLYEHSAGIIAVVISLIHDAQELAIINQSETLGLGILNTVYAQRMRMIDIYITSSIKKNSQTSRVTKKKSEVLPVVEGVTDKEQDVYELIMDARRRNGGVVDALKEAGYITEVAI